MSSQLRILQPTTNEVDIRHTLYSQFQFEIEHSDYSLYALTLTLNSNEYTTLKKNNADILDYFNFLLKKHKINGVFITEHTQKGIEHIHGIIYQYKKTSDLKKVVRKKRIKYDVSYRDPEIQNQHVIKPLTSAAAFNGWQNYMCKNATPATFIDYLISTISPST